MTFLSTLDQLLDDRYKNPKEGSYTSTLFEQGVDRIARKVGEEAAELIIAAKNNDPEEISNEAADLLYHVMVLMSRARIVFARCCGCIRKTPYLGAV